MMKKQFYRVKQLADQTFNKAEKSDLLNFEELQEADKNVEYLQEVLSSFVKKVQTAPNLDTDKRMKKTFEFGLSTVYRTPKPPEDNRLFSDICRVFSEIQKNLAKEHAEHENRVEELVSNPLQVIVEQDFSNISKQKKTLNKYLLDKDSASNRYQNTKKDAIKEDMEEADNKVDHTRDNLALEMFSILSRENEISSYILQYLKLQQAYYKSALDCLEVTIPELEKKIGNSKIKKIFGTPLQDHLQIYQTKIALPLEICVRALMKESMEEEGLFRMAGSVLKVKRLKASMDSGCFKGLIPEYRDVHLLASIVKLYLRELPEPLLTFELYNDWMQVIKHPENQRVQAIKRILDRLPIGNRDNLAYFMQFLAKLVTYQKVNKMNTSNVATVVGPSLLWERQTDKEGLNMSHCATINMIVETLIKEVHQFFPEDLTQFERFTPLFVDEERHSRHIHADFSNSTESINNTIEGNSPKPATRGHKKRAPGPPSRTDQDLTNNSEKSSMGASYPSGSSTLHRPPKIKSSIGVNTEETAVNFINNERKTSLVKVKADNLMSFDNPEPQENGTIVTTAVYHVPNNTKPVAAPRTHIGDTDGVTLRKPEEKPAKPEVPVRPASLSSGVKRSSDENTWKTHVQLSSVANKQQAAIVNLHNSEAFQPGHDCHILRKEQFLHQAHNVVPAPRHTLQKQAHQTNELSKSTEKLNDNTSDNKPSHVRTKSDGNIMDYGDGNVAKTPPSPRNLNKPTQPPPPPPVATAKIKPPESTDF